MAYASQLVSTPDHAAVKAILGTPKLTGQHALWLSKLYTEVGLRK